MTVLSQAKMANPPNGDSGVGGEVLRLNKEVSQYFVPEPKDAQPILRSLFVALGRFEHCVRWKKYHFDRYVEEQTKARCETLNLLDDSDVSGSSQESDSSRQVRRSERIRELEEKRIRKLAEEFADADGDPGDDDEKDPGTGLKAEGSEPIAPIADCETELFLKEVRKALLGRFKDGLINTVEPCELDREIRAVLLELEKQENMVVVPSDKTNRMIPVKLDWYIKRMEQCISDDAVEVDKEFLDFSYDHATNELDDSALLDDSSSTTSDSSILLISSNKSTVILRPTPKLQRRREVDEIDGVACTRMKEFRRTLVWGLKWKVANPLLLLVIASPKCF